MPAKTIAPKSSRARRIAAIVFLIAVLPTMFFALRSYGSFRLLRSAYEAGAPMTSSVRVWMTLKYVAATYRAPEPALIAQLELPPQTDPDTSLRTLADRAGVPPSAYTQRVQRVIAALSPDVRSDRSSGDSGWFGTIGDQVLTAVLVYGYPALGLTLLLGAIGLPLPDGVATIVAGSLASQGRIDWFWAAAISVTASLAGDAVGYGLGRLLSQNFFDRHGHWLGLTRARRAHAQSLFDRWGLLTVFITRTFMSYLSSIASLLAGVSHYRLPKFLATALAGRLVWTAGYFGLGYGIGGDWEAATNFLTNLSALLLLLALLAATGAVASGRFVASPQRSTSAADHMI
jgi:membrane protein DedA with SNARE-associated domain